MIIRALVDITSPRNIRSTKRLLSSVLKQEKRLDYVANVSYSFGQNDCLPVLEKLRAQSRDEEAKIASRLEQLEEAEPSGGNMYASDAVYRLHGVESHNDEFVADAQNVLRCAQAFCRHRIRSNAV